jgi:hypothetical protein
VNKEAPELSPEARRLIHAARGVDDPTAEDQARVKARWLASVAAVAGVSSLTEAARAAGGIGWGLKAAGAALVLAAGAIGLYVALPPDTANEAKRAGAPLPAWSGTTHARHEKTPAGEHQALANQPAEKLDDGVAAAPPRPSPSQGAVEPEAFIVPAVSPPPVVPSVEIASPAPSVLEPAEVPTREGVALDVGVEAPATEATVAVREPVARQAAARLPRRQRGAAVRTKPSQPVAVPDEAPAAAPAAPSTGQNGQLSDELALLSEVRSSVQGPTPARALELLGQYRSRFGRPILGMEADALRVDALCKTGQRDAAQASARAFQNDWPGSPLERRVSAACP